MSIKASDSKVWPPQTWKDVVLYIWLAMLGVSVIISVGPGWAHAAAWWEKQDLPAWVQAIGSVTAIFWAIQLATKENRRRLAEERLQGELVALRMILCLGNLIDWSEGVVTSVTKPRETPTKEAFAAIVRRYDSLGRPPIEDIAPALHRVQSGVSARLITIWAFIDKAVIVMRCVAEEDVVKYNNPEAIVLDTVKDLPVELRASRWQIANWLTSQGYIINIPDEPIEDAVQTAVRKLDAG